MTPPEQSPLAPLSPRHIAAVRAFHRLISDTSYGDLMVGVLDIANTLTSIATRMEFVVIGESRRFTSGEVEQLETLAADLVESAKRVKHASASTADDLHEADDWLTLALEMIAATQSMRRYLVPE